MPWLDLFLAYAALILAGIPIAIFTAADAPKGD